MEIHSHSTKVHAPTAFVNTAKSRTGIPMRLSSLCADYGFEPYARNMDLTADTSTQSHSTKEQNPRRGFSGIEFRNTAQCQSLSQSLCACLGCLHNFLISSGVALRFSSDWAIVVQAANSRNGAAEYLVQYLHQLQTSLQIEIAILHFSEPAVGF